MSGSTNGDVHVKLEPGQQVVIVDAGRRVVTVPSWVPTHVVWRTILVLIVLVAALVPATVVVWKLQETTACNARRNGTLDVARSVKGSKSDFPDDPGVQDGLETIARGIRRGAETC